MAAQTRTRGEPYARPWAKKLARPKCSYLGPPRDRRCQPVAAWPEGHLRGAAKLTRLNRAVHWKAPAAGSRLAH